jgi:hypothetical protein
MVDEPFVHARLVESVRAIGQPPRCLTGYKVLQEKDAIIRSALMIEKNCAEQMPTTSHLVANKSWYEIAC